MTPKEKAKDLVLKFARLHKPNYNKKLEKQCAIIAADEALNIFIEIHKKLVETDVQESATYKYWQEVKQKIEKL